MHSGRMPSVWEVLTNTIAENIHSSPAHAMQRMADIPKSWLKLTGFHVPDQQPAVCWLQGELSDEVFEYR